MSAFDATCALIEDALDLEDLAGARLNFAALEPATDAEHWRREVMRMFMSRPDGDLPAFRVPVDEMCLALSTLSTDSRAEGQLAERAFLGSLSVSLARRRHDYVIAQLDAWEEANGASGRTVAYRGHTLAAKDEPEAALAVLAPALGKYPTQHVDAELAGLYYRVAEFDQTLALASQLGDGRFRLTAAQLEASVAASTGDLEGELAALTRLLELAPNSEETPNRLVQRALVAASLDRLSDARRDLERALATVPRAERPDAARYVRQRLDALDAASNGARHYRLSAFPSIVQKWNYCGPAVVELCLRYAGVEMTQDLIAQAVKRPEGTPMYKIVEFLREQGFEVRRIEASVSGIKAAIDAGVPLIVESAYSNSSHVSVAVGYDDRLGVLIMADPMTHAPIRESVEARGEVAKRLRFGAVAVLGRATDVTQATRDALDAAGLVESEVVSRFDDIGREYDEFAPAFSSTSALEVAGIAREVLAREQDFEEAAVAFASATQAAADDWESDGRAWRAITSMRSRFPERSGFAVMASHWYGSGAERPLAVADAVVSSQLDAGAAHPRGVVAAMLIEDGERALAYRYANDAFLRAPFSAGPTLDLAVLAARELVERARARGELGAFASAVAPSTTDAVWGIDDALLESLAPWLAEAAVDMAPEAPMGHVAQGDLAMLAGDAHTAASHYRRACDVAGAWYVPYLRLAFALEGPAPDEARDTLRGLADRGRLPSAGWSAIVELAGRLGEVELATTSALAAVDSSEDAGTVLDALYTALREHGLSEPECARALVSIVHDRPGNEEAFNGAVSVLEEANLRGFAATLLREYLARVPDDARALYRLAHLICRTPSERDEAIGYMERARELAPWADVLGIELGWLVLDRDPLRARNIVANLEGGFFGQIELARIAAQRVSDRNDEVEADVLLEGMCGSEFYARLAAARYHLDADRVAEAMAVELEGEPRDGDVDDIAAWLRVLRQTGRMGEAVDYVAAHPELAEHREIAPIIAFAGDLTHSEIVLRAARAASSQIAAGPWANYFAAEAMCLAGRVEEALETFSDDALALTRCVEWLTEPTARQRVAERAFAMAPEDRTVLAAWHSELMDAGRVDEARQIAENLLENFPYEHQAAERMAEVELYTGDPDAAIQWAATAVSEDPHCVRALAAAALADAVAGDWPRAEMHAARHDAIARPLAHSVDTSPAGLVSAALARDHKLYARRLEAVKASAPGLPLARIAEVCEARLAEPSAK